jgi:hypothetical protein
MDDLTDITTPFHHNTVTICCHETRTKLQKGVISVQCHPNKERAKPESSYFRLPSINTSFATSSLLKCQENHEPTEDQEGCQPASGVLIKLMEARE